MLNMLCSLAFLRQHGLPFITANASQTPDFTEMPTESLLNREVYSASKFTQKKTDAPTAVTVIDAQGIKDFGYRTLADIIQSVRGVYVDNDRNYSTVGSLGFNIPGDENTRMVILLDGYRLNDTIYDQEPLGTEFRPETNNGITSNGDYENGERVFGRFSWRHFTFESAYSKRNKGLPIGAYGMVSNDPRNPNTDQHVFFNLTYNDQISDHLELYALASHGRYDYPRTWINDYPPVTLSKELGIGRWWGTETRLISTHFEGHKLMLGTEFQANETLAWSLVSIDPYDPETSQSFSHATDHYGLYLLQDEVALSKNIILNAGLRYDHLSYANDDINPHLDLIYKPWENTAFKLLYGSSFRAPNSNELYYTDSITITSTPLNPEHIKTYEGIIECQIDRSLRLTAVGFHYEIDSLIQLKEIISPSTGEVKNQFINAGANNASEVELEFEKLWDYGCRLRASYTWAEAYNNNHNFRLINSPNHLFKLNFSTPLLQNWLRAGVEAQYTSRRQGRDNTITNGYSLFNLTLTSTDKLFAGRLKGVEVSGSIYNLLDSHYASIPSEEYIQQYIPQNGRNFRLVFSYWF